VGIAVANGGDRPPEIVVILGVQYRDERVVEPKRQIRHEARAIDDVHLLYGDELAYERMIGSRCADEPEPGRLGLLFVSPGAALGTILLDLIVVRRPFLAVERDRRL